jgi:hypothetical protein
MNYHFTVTVFLLVAMSFQAKGEDTFMVSSCAIPGYPLPVDSSAPELMTVTVNGKGVIQFAACNPVTFAGRTYALIVAEAIMPQIQKHRSTMGDWRARLQIGGRWHWIERPHGGVCLPINRSNCFWQMSGEMGAESARVSLHFQGNPRLEADVHWLNSPKLSPVY